MTQPKRERSRRSVTTSRSRAALTRCRRKRMSPASATKAATSAITSRQLHKNDLVRSRSSAPLIIDRDTEALWLPFRAFTGYWTGQCPELAHAQQVRFCASPDGVQIAYSVIGAGEPLVMSASWLTHLCATIRRVRVDIHQCTVANIQRLRFAVDYAT